MPKPSAAALQQAARDLDLDGFDYAITLETSHGPIRLTLDSANAPGHVRNLVALAESGFYDGGCFHRIIKGFMIQGGCPDGSGTGGPGYQIPAEFNATPHEPGVLSMARTSDPELGRQPVLHLPGEGAPPRPAIHRLRRTADAESLAVVKAIGEVATAAQDRPVKPVTIDKATVTKTPKR